MTSQVIFKLDTKLKKQAMQKAASDGVAFSSVLKLAIKAYVEGNLNIGVYVPPKFNEKTRRELTKALKDIKQGKGLSPRFTNSEDAIAYLNSL